MGIFSKRKKANRFLQLLAQQAEYAVKGLEVLRNYMREPKPALAEQVSKIEKEADEARRILIDELNHTFVTPFDREDIFALSLTIDDVLDYAATTVDEMAMLEVEPNQYLERMASLLYDAAVESIEASFAWKIIPMWPMTTRCAPRRWKTAWRVCIARRWRLCSRPPTTWPAWWRF